MVENNSKSFELVKTFLGKKVELKVDRPLGTKHPKHNYIYNVNYGYVPGIMAPDGEELDAYFLGVTEPVVAGTGICRAIIHRFNDDDDKLIVCAGDFDPSDEEIENFINFQEKYFKHEIIRS